MAEFDDFAGTVGTTWRDSTPWWPGTHPKRDTASRPNVLLVLFDDLGFSHFGCYGSTISTPTVDRLAQNGVSFTSFHVTPLCAPTRAALLTGRNHHAVGMGDLTQFSSGYPGYHARIPREAGTIAENLREAGYATFATGKWHLAPETDINASGPFDTWPLGRGFERYYGFLQGKTDHWHPELVEDNHHVDIPARHSYHLTEDLVDHAISFVRDRQVSAPDQPFFLYLPLGAVHSPHHAPQHYIDRYRGEFDEGWDVVRSRWFERQKESGIVPDTTVLPPRNPSVPAWSDLSADDRAYLARGQEAFAGFLEHTDDQLARLVEHLRRTDALDDTIILVMSDNGAAATGGVYGSLNDERLVNGIAETHDERMAAMDRLGGPDFFNLYSSGWAMAGNTPLRWYKQMTHGGGVRSPLVVHWPAGLTGAGGIRRQFGYVTDIFPTILELAGVPSRREIGGVPQMALDGTSLAYALHDVDAPSRHGVQYFEMSGHRAIIAAGWKAVTYHESGADYEDEPWELFRLDEDFSESRDLAKEEPERLAELVGLWWQEARANNALPLDDRRWERYRDTREPGLERHEFTFLPGAPPLVSEGAPDLRNRSFSIVAEIDHIGESKGGVLFCAGGRHGGLVLYLLDGRVIFDYNSVGEHFRLESETVDFGDGSAVEFAFTKTGTLRGYGRILLDGVDKGGREFPRTLPNRIFLRGAEAGLNRASPVDPRYDSPFVFDGSLRRVVVSLRDDQRLDYASEREGTGKRGFADVDGGA